MCTRRTHVQPASYDLLPRLKPPTPPRPGLVWGRGMRYVDELRLYGVLRRLMCNELDQQVRQVAQRSAQGIVDPLPTGVRRDLGRQAGQQPAQGLGPVALQSEEVLELVDHPLDDLTMARRPAAIGLRPCPTGVVLRGGSHQCPIDLQPAPLPLESREAFVRQVGIVTVGGYEGIPYGSLVGGRRCQPEGAHYALGVHHQRHLEPVDPLGLGRTPPEGCLSGKQPLARSPHPHHRWDERRIQDAVYGRRVGQFSGEGTLQSAQLGRKGPYPPVELALATEVREVGAQVRGGETPEVALAAEARPLSEYGQGQNL